MAKSHARINEELQTCLAYVGELIDSGHDFMSDALADLYEWIELIMVDHHALIND
jgi:hypothetical protein